MSDKIAEKTVIILPTYNEKNNIEKIIKDIFFIFPEINILVVDDNSPDKTAEVVKDIIPRYPNLKIMERPLKTGLGNAYKDAIKKIILDKNFSVIVTMDADGSHQPKYLKDFLNEIEKYDLIIGSRYIPFGGVENWEIWRRLLSKFGNIYAKILTGVKIEDLTAGFICIKKEFLEKIDFNKINADGYAYQIEFKYYCVKKLGAKFKEVPIIFKERLKDGSKMSKQIISEGIIAPLRIFIKRLIFTKE